MKFLKQFLISFFPTISRIESCYNFLLPIKSFKYFSRLKKWEKDFLFNNFFFFIINIIIKYRQMLCVLINNSVLVGFIQIFFLFLIFKTFYTDTYFFPWFFKIVFFSCYKFNNSFSAFLNKKLSYVFHFTFFSWTIDIIQKTIREFYRK